MKNRRNKSGFSLIEALFASAILIAIIVPAMLTFRTHLAAVSRMQSELDAEFALSTLSANTERAVLFSSEDYPAGAVTLSGPVHTVLSKPETSATGPAELVRYDLSVKTEDGAISREAILYSIRPATNCCDMSLQSGSMK